jgi:subtilisin family serine protease
MLYRFLNGLCLAALLCFVIKDTWKPSPISPYTLVGASHAHERSLHGRGVIVAVLDEGFDASHDFLKDSFSSFHRYTTASSKSQDISESLVFENGKYTFESHGTHVSGIISKVAPHAKIIPIKVESFGGDQSFVKALQMAENSPAHVVNISLRLSYTGREISPNVRTALLQLAQAGKLIVIAAGNDSSSMMNQPYTASLVELSTNPLMKGRLLLVGASSYKNGTESLAEFSNFPGPNACGISQPYFITAPGDNIKSAITGGVFAEKSGTSMAAPMVAAAASILIEAYPHLEAENIIHQLLHSARKVGLDGKRLSFEQFGAGILNLKGALEKR